MAATSRLYDPAWRSTYLGADARWNLDVLHLLAAPVSAADWHYLESLRLSGLTAEEAVATYQKKA